MTTHDSCAMAVAGAASPRFRRSKAAAAWLACLFGVFGVHGWYLGRRRAWMVGAFSCLMLVLAQFFPSWWENPAFLLLLVPLSAGYIEALVLALKPDEWFDAKYNPGMGRVTHTGWGPVIAAIVTTLLGGTVLMFGLAVVVVYVYTSMGWLDGLVL